MEQKEYKKTDDTLSFLKTYIIEMKVYGSFSGQNQHMSFAFTQFH